MTLQYVHTLDDCTKVTLEITIDLEMNTFDLKERVTAFTPMAV